MASLSCVASRPSTPSRMVAWPHTTASMIWSATVLQTLSMDCMNSASTCEATSMSSMSMSRNDRRGESFEPTRLLNARSLGMICSTLSYSTHVHVGS
eukprot:5004433-Prymnesium_polylepis.3